jgi:DNA-binding HxlR family transcriptional regulator
VQAKWTNAILDEMFTALRRNRPDIAQVIVTRNLKDFPPEAIEDVLSQLERDGLVESATALRAA